MTEAVTRRTEATETASEQLVGSNFALNLFESLIKYMFLSCIVLHKYKIIYHMEDGKIQV